jgi:hypothetical protein
VRESSQLFVVGLAERGPTDEAVLVQSIADFEYNFGGYISDSYLHSTVETFFEEGGTQAYVSRVVGSGATTGDLDLVNNSASTTVLLNIAANGPGDWSEDVYVSVTTPTPGTNFRVNIFYPTSSDLVYSTGTVTSVAQAAGRINLSSVASRYVTATATAGATTLPSAVGPVALSAGDSDHATVDDTALIDGLDLFNDALGSGAVCIPDAETVDYVTGGTPYTDYDGTSKATPEVSLAIIEHCNANNRIAILHAGATDSSDDAISKAEDIQSEDNAEHAALYFPWITVPTSTPGVTRNIPPDGYIAAKRALAHNQSGPQVAAAGLISAARFVSGTVTDINKTVGDALDAAQVNAIRVIQNSVRIYGARSLSLDEENFRFITTQDIVNTVVVDSQRSLEDLVFSVIDGRDTIFSAITARLIAILAPLREQGALFQAFDANGRKIDNGYTVRCDAALNPVTQLAGGTVKAKIGLRTSSIGDKIEVDIIKSNLTASVV